jgi:octaprenyl-diphosphate synthase
VSTKPAVSAAVSRKAASIDELQPVYALVRDDFANVNALIPEQLTSDVSLVEEIGSYIVESGGKRLRPLMVLLATGALGYSGDKHVKLAAIIEFLHTATLLHDDVVDHSGMRRGKLTANEKWGNAPSVLVGDFLYSRAFQLMVEVGSMEIMGILASATNTIAEGEVLQLANVGNVEITEAQYREVIRCKTALLFEAATHTGALLPDTATPAETEALRRFGLHFGITYQLVDDWLDYAGDSETLGKNVGDDLAEGKLTLPLIYALAHTGEAAQRIIREAIQKQSSTELAQIIDIVEGCAALDYTHNAAVTEAELALACLASVPAGPYTDALRTVTEYSTARLF